MTKRDKHLPPGVYLKHGAYYHVRSRKWVRIGATLQEALAEYAVYIAAPKGGMASLIDAALNHKRPQLAPSTVKLYDQVAVHLKQWLQDFAPEQVRPKHIVAIKRKLVATPNYSNLVISVLRTVFDYALEAELVESNPAVGVKKYPEAKRTRLITPEEYRAIYTHAEPRLQVIMDLAVRTGQRITDVLTIKNADLTADGIAFEQQKTGARGTVAWTPELRRITARARGLNGNCVSLVYLLQNRRRRPPDYRTVLRQWGAACRAASVQDAHLHDLRALAGTLVKRQGKDAQALLMHTSERQTARYLRDRQVPVVEGPTFDDLLATTPKG